MAIRTKNIYDPASPEDGLRLLVMRKWPPGVSRDRVDRWEKDLSSASLLGLTAIWNIALLCGCRD